MLPSIVILTLSLATGDLLTSAPIAPSAMKMLFTGASTPFGYSLQHLLPFNCWLISQILLQCDRVPSIIWHKGNSLYTLCPPMLSIKLISSGKKKKKSNIAVVQWKAFDMGTGVQQIWILQQYGLLMLGKLSLQIFLQSEPHTAFITACSAGPRAPISVVKGYEWQDAVLHGRGLQSNEARGATARNQPKGRHLLSFPLTAQQHEKIYTHNYKDTNSPAAPQNPGCKEKTTGEQAAYPFESMLQKVRCADQEEDRNWPGEKSKVVISGVKQKPKWI